MTHEGFWGNRTATIDWCESNYEVTTYIAEFWNTISNLVMILFPLYAIYWSIRHNRLAKKSSKSVKTSFFIPNSTIYCQFGLLLVGCGSWMFHMTLLYPMQLLDELPMLYCAAFMIYASYDLILSAKNYERKQLKINEKKTLLMKLFETRPLVLTLLIIFCILVTFMYVSVLTSPIFHELAYAFMVFIIVVESFILLRTFSSSTRILLFSFVYYATGFLFWNIDNHFCDQLKSYRSFLGETFGIDGSNNLVSILFNSLVICLKSIFEFHALWHIFCGFGTYVTILFLLESNYQLHLTKTNKLGKEVKQVVGSKYANMYFHLTNDHLELKRDV